MTAYLDLPALPIDAVTDGLLAQIFTVRDTSPKFDELDWPDPD